MLKAAKTALSNSIEAGRKDCGFNPLWFPVAGLIGGGVIGCVVGGIGLLLR